MDNLPIGTIIAWENAAIPSGWAVCDGQNGRPNLINKFVRGASSDGQVRATGGAENHSHTNPGTAERAAHNHGGSKALSIGGGSGSTSGTVGSGDNSASPEHGHGSGSAGISITSADAHSHTVPGTSTVGHVPPYITRVFIQRVA
ncbi:MAG: hypothetical protein WBL58_04875 [Peptococcia bacterium]